MSETTPSAVVTATQAVPAAPRSAKRPARPRKAAAGDIAPSLQASSLERHTVNEAVSAAQLASGAAMEDILSQIKPGDTESMLKTLEVFMSGLAADDALADTRPGLTRQCTSFAENERAVIGRANRRTRTDPGGAVGRPDASAAKRIGTRLGDRHFDRLSPNQDRLAGRGANALRMASRGPVRRRLRQSRASHLG